MTRQDVDKLLKKACDANKSEDALRFSQAALNAAHAVNIAMMLPKRPADNES